ncbi:MULTISPECIES: response regulator [unclassified Sphingomonas]|uniref:response regulator n=1 Tax=unclassified Sphingomonas TaxID=196159 RepID=UPI000369736F|nr:MULTISPECIES: response regulator [unclassified Sphingomonas]
MGQQFSSTVLIVDDEDYIRALASAVLQEEGFDVLQAASTSEALYLASTHEIDVLLTDLHMPGPMDGLQLAAQIRTKAPLLHVIISSGDDESVANKDAIDAVFLPKPYRPHQLTGAVRAHFIG